MTSRAGWWTPGDLAALTGLRRQSIRAALHRARKRYVVTGKWPKRGIPAPDPVAGLLWREGRRDVVVWVEEAKARKTQRTAKEEAK